MLQGEMKNNRDSQKCILCKNEELVAFDVPIPPNFFYFQCSLCEIIFLDPQRRLSLEEEKIRYGFHEYHDTESYRDFYAPFLFQIESHFVNLKRVGRVLDYGSGPQSLLAKILRENRVEVACYDPFFANEPELLQQKYDLIVSTEVFEHFFNPLQEMNRLTNLFESGGTLAVLTSFHQGRTHFQNWHYRRDPTHVTFYNEKTFQWICEQFQLNCIVNEKSIFMGQWKM